MRVLIALLAMAAISGCAQTPDYEFRSADRPAFDNTLSVAAFTEARDQEDVVVLDVRLREDYAANPVLIPGANYRDPETISEWSSSLPKDKKVLVYCVKGKWVSQKAANYLAAEGYDVYSLEGGIEAWQADAQNR